MLVRSDMSYYTYSTVVDVLLPRTVQVTLSSRMGWLM
jgi:hypothetical protein